MIYSDFRSDMENSLKAARDDHLGRLVDVGITCTPGRWCSGAFKLKLTGEPGRAYDSKWSFRPELNLKDSSGRSSCDLQALPFPLRLDEAAVSFQPSPIQIFFGTPTNRIANRLAGWGQAANLFRHAIQFCTACHADRSRRSSPGNEKNILFCGPSLRAITYFINLSRGSVFNGFGRSETSFCKFAFADPQI